MVKGGKQQGDDCHVHMQDGKFARQASGSLADPLLCKAFQPTFLDAGAALHLLYALMTSQVQFLVAKWCANIHQQVLCTHVGATFASILAPRWSCFVCSQK